MRESQKKIKKNQTKASDSKQRVSVMGTIFLLCGTLLVLLFGVNGLPAAALCFMGGVYGISSAGSGLRDDAEY